MAQPTIISHKQLAQHTGKDDAWVAIEDKVYNVSRYLDDHPGGESILLSVAGCNATDAFQDAGHSDGARRMLTSMLVGSLQVSDTPQANRTKFHWKAVPVKTPDSMTSALQHQIRRILRTLSNIKTLVGITFSIALVGMSWMQLQAAFSFWVTRAVSSIPMFWQGALFASIGSSTILLSIGRIFAKTLVITKGLRQFPPVVKPRIAQRRPHLWWAKRTTTLPPPPPQLPKKCKGMAFTLQERVQISADTFRLVFNSHSLQPRNASFLVPLGQHVMVDATIDGQRVSRKYTPITSDGTRLELVVKVYVDGRMGNYLRDLSLGSSVLVDGPSGNFHGYQPSSRKELAMVAGGTGITPLLSIIRAVCLDPSDATPISLVYANRTEQDILLRDTLDDLAQHFPHQLKVCYVLSGVLKKSTWRGERGRLTQALLARHLPSPQDRRNQFLLCGPAGMVEDIKKILATMGSERARIVSRISDQLFVF